MSKRFVNLKQVTVMCKRLLAMEREIDVARLERTLLFVFRAYNKIIEEELIRLGPHGTRISSKKLKFLLASKQPRQR